MEFELKSEYIELMKLLKFLGWVSTGGEAKTVIEEGLVKVNGETEFRKRNKLRKGDVVELESNRVLIV